jgi:hypothetical protein
MTTDKEMRLERRSDRRLLVMPRVVATHTGGGIRCCWSESIGADEEHVYCLMDDAGTTLATTHCSSPHHLFAAQASAGAWVCPYAGAGEAAPYMPDRAGAVFGCPGPAD